MHTCNKCGAQFNSPFCPNCGTPAVQPNNQLIFQQQPFNNPYPYQQQKKKKYGCLFWGVIVSCTIIGLFILSVMLISCMNAFTNGFKEGLDRAKSAETNGVDKDPDNAAVVSVIPPTPTIYPYIQITSTELIASYKNNQVKCKQLYDNQLLEVTGTVQSVGTDILDNTYVCLGSDEEYTFVGIQCYAKNKDEVNKIAELKEGDIITVRGKGDCGSLTFTLEDAMRPFQSPCKLKKLI